MSNLPLIEGGTSMIKKMFTLSSIAFLLVCNTLNTLEFKLQNKSNKPIFIRFFEKKSGVLTPPLNNFSLVKLDVKEKTNRTFEGQIYLCISLVDPASTNESKVHFYRFSPEKNVVIHVGENGHINIPPILQLLKERYVHNCRTIFIDIKKNEKGKWKIPEDLIRPPKEKFTIQQPIIIEDQPLPQTIKVIEQSSYLNRSAIKRDSNNIH